MSIGDAKWLADRRARAVIALSTMQRATTRPTPPVTDSPVAPVDPRLRKRGWPCGAVNRSFYEQMKEFASVKTSGSLPAEIAESRLESCDDCPHCTVRDVKGDGVFRHFCQCCGCPMGRLGLLIGSDMESKVKYAGLQCPRPSPAFGVWKAGIEASI